MAHSVLLLPAALLLHVRMHPRGTHTTESLYVRLELDDSAAAVSGPGFPALTHDGI